LKTRVFFCLVGIAFLLCASKIAKAATTNFIWVGVNSTVWTDPGNWGDATTLTYPISNYPGQLSAADIANIGTINLVPYGYSLANQPVLSTSKTIGQLNFGQYYTNKLTISSGITLTINGSITNNASTNTTIAGPGTIIGTSGITVNSGGTLTASTTIAGASLTMAGGTLSMGSAVTVTGSVTVNGTSTISGGATLTAASSTVNAATLNLNTPLSLSGAFTAASGNTVNSNGSGTITAASLAITAGTFSLNAAVTLSGGLTINNGNTTFNSTALTKTASMSTGTGTLTLDGALIIGSSGITVNGTTINGSSVAAITTTGGGGLNLTSATVTLNGVLTINGVVQAPGPGGTASTLTTNATGNTLSGGIYDHTGSNLTWNGSGTSTCSAGDVSSGQTLTIGAGNTINFTGPLEMHSSAVDGNLVNGGNITMTNASMFSDNLSSGSTSPITNLAGGTITLTGPSAQLSGGSFTNISNSGTITANTGTQINTGALGIITNNSTGVITMTSATMSMNGNPSTLSNAGTINFTSSTLNAGGNSPVIGNTGTINASALTANLTGNGLSFNNGGTITSTSATTYKFSGSPQTITNSGNFSLDASTITNSGSNNPIVNSGNFTLANASTITVSGGGSSPVTNSGHFISTSSAINFNAGTGNAVSNTGVFSATSSPVTFGGGAWTLTNSGTFSAISGSTISMPGNSSYISNTAGTFTVTSSNISLTGQPVYIQNSGTGTFNASGSTIGLAQSDYIQQTSSNAVTINGTSTVNFGVGSYISTSSSSGAFYAGTSGSSCILNLINQNANISNSGKFYLGSTSIIYPTANNAQITNNSGGLFTLQSDVNGTAAIASLNSAASCSGTFSVERYFQGSTLYDNTKKRWYGRNYRIISSPVNIGGGNNAFGLNYIVGFTAGLTTTANSLTNAFVTGCTGGSTAAGNPSLYLYNETLVPNNSTFTSGNFIGITNITNSSSTGSTPAGAITTSAGATAYNIPVGNGVLFFFRGNASSWATRTASPYIAPENVTLTSTGSINQQSITVKNWYNSSSSTLGYTVTGIGTGSNTNTAVRGFNMVGNPYPSSIDWNSSFSGTGITRTNINPTIWVFNPVTNQYDTWKTTSSSTGVSNVGGSATNIIASGQGFFVQANLASPALVFTEAAKSPASQLTGGNLLMGTPAQNAVQQLLRLRLSIDTLNYDDIAIGFNSAASTKYNGQEDAEYLPGINANEGLSSYSSDSVRLAINFLPLPKQNQQVIKLDVEARLSGLYKFQRTTLDAIPQIYEIWLMDSYKRDSLDLRNNSTYAFNVDLADINSYGSNRFRLIIRQNAALGIHLLDFTATRTSSGGAQVVWKTENEQNYTNFTIERSSNGGVTFDVLGGVLSSAQGTYSFLDKNPPATADQYRLRVEDLNSAISYSNVVTLTFGNAVGTVAVSNISVYPNPATNVINLTIKPKLNTISYSSNLSALQQLSVTPDLTSAQTNTTGTPSYKIKIISITGSVITTATSSQPIWQNNVGNLLPGTYIIQVVNSNDTSLVGKSTFVKL
jgi:trimeric autotransporter adhesin